MKAIAVLEMSEPGWRTVEDSAAVFFIDLDRVNEDSALQCAYRDIVMEAIRGPGNEAVTTPDISQLSGDEPLWDLCIDPPCEVTTLVKLHVTTTGKELSEDDGE